MVTLITQRSSGSRGPPRWRLQEFLLSDPIQCTLLETAVKEYFLINETSEVSRSTVWAAHKSVIRGKLIQLASKLKAEHRADTLKHTEQFRTLAKAHKHNPTPELLAKLDTARALFNLTLTTAAEKHLRWTGAKFYSQKDRIGSRLAVKLSPKQRTLAFPKICAASGVLTQNPTKIMDAFLQFYSDLYKPIPPPPDSLRTLFLITSLCPH